MVRSLAFWRVRSAAALALSRSPGDVESSELDPAITILAEEAARRNTRPVIPVTGEPPVIPVTGEPQSVLPGDERRAGRALSCVDDYETRPVCLAQDQNVLDDVQLVGHKVSSVYSSFRWSQTATSETTSSRTLHPPSAAVLNHFSCAGLLARGPYPR